MDRRAFANKSRARFEFRMFAPHAPALPYHVNRKRIGRGISRRLSDAAAIRCAGLATLIYMRREALGDQFSGPGAISKITF
jgi:hypothetical protein